MPTPKQSNDPACGTAAIPAAAWWDRLFNASEDAQIICRADGTIERINPKAQQFLDFRSADEGLGTSILSIFTAEARKRVSGLLSSTRKFHETIPSAPLMVNDRVAGIAD